MDHQPERESSRTRRETISSAPMVLGMHASLSFATGGLVKVDVTISQATSPDDSSDYVMSASQASASEDVTPLAMDADGAYTAGQALLIELVVTNAGTPRTLSATIPAVDVVAGTQPTFQLVNGAGTETLSGAVQLLSGGAADVTLDLSSDSALGSGAIEFTLSCGPAGAVARTNVTGLEGRSAYTAGEAYLFEVAYVDGNGASQSYSVRAPANEVHAGNTYSHAMQTS